MSAPPFFIVGSARSGTTMLRMIFNAHPQVVVPPESRFIVDLWAGSEDVAVSDYLSRLQSHSIFRDYWDLPPAEIKREIGDRQVCRYEEAVRATYSAYTRLRGGSRWGDKTPRYVESISFIAGLLPDARFIHLIRDGRDVALSYAEVPFGPKTVGKAAALWARRVTEGRSAGRELDPGRYMELNYEALVEATEYHVKELCAFLALDFEPGMLDYGERARDSILERATRYNPNVTTGGVGGRKRSWERTMPESHIRMFEAVAGPTLSQFGYERRYSRPGVRVRLAAWLSRRGLGVGRMRKGRSV